MKSASRMEGSSFQKQTWTSAKMPRLRISSAWSKYGVEESGFSVEPWPTIKRAEFGFGVKDMAASWRASVTLQVCVGMRDLPGPRGSGFSLIRSKEKRSQRP